MTDLYAKCPCGSGKKIKFCCKDIIADIELIERMLKGDQRTAALDKIEKLLEKHPQRPALLSMRARVYLEMQKLDEARPAIDELLAVEPENPSALAMKATVTSVDGDMTASLRLLHKALRCSDGVLSQMVYRAYLSLCVHLIQREEFISAYAHLLTLVSITKGQDRTSVSMLMKVTSTERLPAIFQGLLVRDETPENVTWQREFDVAIEMYRHGDWSEAASMLEDMSSRILDEPVILRNQAILQAWTCQNEKAIKSFRYFAAIREASIADAVEAEACAQVLEPAEEVDTIEMVAITRDIDDAQAMMEKLLSEDTVDSLPVRHDPESGSPPPKGQFVFFDRRLPDDEEENNEAKLADFPKELCSATLFGKETDRSARLSVVVFRDDQFTDTLKTVSERIGIELSENDEFETLTRLHKMERLFRPPYKVPPKTSLERYNVMQSEWVIDQISKVWPTMSLAVFGGKTPTEAATEKKLQRCVLAAILNLEIWADRQPFEFDFNTLRQKLGLPEAQPIDPNDVDVRALSPTQLLRLQLDKLSTEDLKFIFEVVSVRPNGSLLHSICQEILIRDGIESEIDLVEVHERLADLSTDSDKQLEHLGKARDLSVSKGESPASWLVAELDIRIQRGEADVAKRLIAEIQSRYMREPGVGQMLAQVLSKYGLMPAGPPGAMPQPVGPDGVPAGVGGAAETPAAGGVWTPGSAEPAAPQESGGGESKLWIPGMD